MARTIIQSAAEQMMYEQQRYAAEILRQQYMNAQVCPPCPQAQDEKKTEPKQNKLLLLI